MGEPLYISSYCVISETAISKNGQLVYHGVNPKDPADFFQAAYKELAFNYPKFYKMDNLCKLGWLAAEVLVHVKTGNNISSFAEENYDPVSVSVLLGNSSSSLDTDLKYYQTVDQMASPALFVYTLPNIVIGEICIRNGWKGENAFFIAENFQSRMFEEQVQMMMSDINNQACVCGWVEIFGTDYKACLFAVEKKNNGQNILFSERNIEMIFNTPQGAFVE